MYKIKLTKLSGEDSNETSLKIGQTIIGHSNSDGLKVGQSFVLIVEIPKQLNIYRTSTVEEILSDNIFRTHNSTYKLEKC